MNDAQEILTVNMMYGGRRIDLNGKLVYAWFDMDKDREEGWFYKPLVKGAAIGGGYAFKAVKKPDTQELAFYTAKTGDKRPVYQGLVIHQDDRTRLTVLDRAADALLQERRRVANNKGLPLSGLEAIRLEYTKTRDRRDRAAILAVVIDYITRGY